MATDIGSRHREGSIWKEVEGEWKQLYGDYYRSGISAEWHDFRCQRPFEWSRSFHPGSLELCINFSGTATLGSNTILQPDTASWYVVDDALSASRAKEENHQFLTIEMSAGWLRSNLRDSVGQLPAALTSFLSGGSEAGMLRTHNLPTELTEVVQDLRSPRRQGPGVGLWQQAKILEILSQTLFEEESELLFCERQKRIAQDRVRRVKAVLSRDLENPPSLTELGKIIGCSPYYLSRLFSQEVGQTISRYLRDLRLNKAAELIRTGSCNVTEAAMAVGYSSLSHFSKAFAELHGHCPCHYLGKKA